MIRKNWNVKKTYSQERNILKEILSNRGLEDTLDVERFLNPPPFNEYYELFSEDFKNSVRLAVEIINNAIKTGKHIVIHGDYDADGISATAILYDTIKNHLAYENVFYFLPNRFKHGYGLSDNSLTEIMQTHPKCLLITVDSGITSIDQVAKANKVGVDVIITDHHQKPSVLPEAKCIVWTDKVVGSGIAWILSRALGSRAKKNIVLASLATVTDLQPVLGVNRVILKHGLNYARDYLPLGLKKLMQVAGRSVEKITSYDFGWIIGPRINASGRMVEPSDALELLLAETDQQAENLAWKLNTVNASRQDKTLEMFDLAADHDPTNMPKIIFSAREDYHEGIIGLVAAKLVQKYYRPAIVVSINEGLGKGSVRSIPGVNIVELLRTFESMFESIGGHPMAAGFSIKAERLPELKEKMHTLGNTNISDECLVPVLDIDMGIDLNNVNLDLANQLLKLEPFGLGNEEPVFCSRNVGVVATDRVGREGQHLSVKFFTENGFFKGIMFGPISDDLKIAPGDKVDVAYTLSINNYLGRTSVDLIIKDIVKG